MFADYTIHCVNLLSGPAGAFCRVFEFLAHIRRDLGSLNSVHLILLPNCGVLQQTTALECGALGT